MDYPVPVPLFDAGDLFAETCCGRTEFIQGGLEVATVVAEPTGSEIIKHRLHCRPILGANL